MSQDASSERAYSKAFDNMVTEGEADIVGLLAYAMYKRVIKEEAAQGIHAQGGPRNPTEVTVAFYRKAAEQQLSEFAASAIDEAKDEIQQSAVLNTVAAQGSDLREHITRRTGWGTAIVTNIVAWMVTTGLAAIVIISLVASGLQETLIQSIAGAVTPERTDARDVDQLPEQTAP